MSFFTDPLNYEFFRQGLLVATLIGGLCGAMGVFIVLRRMSYIGHGLSHAAFGGAVVAYVMNISFFIGAGLWSFMAALLINAAARRRNIGADAAIGIVTTASFALGVAIVSKKRTFTRNFEAALFGNILGISRQDIIIIASVTVCVALAIFFFYKQLLFTTFDEEIAAVSGVDTKWVETGFALALAATVVASMNTVGVTLIAAAIVIPPSTARLVTQTFGKLLVLSTVIGAGTGFFGMFVSFEYDIASGAAIVLLGTAVFLSVYIGTGIWHWIQPPERVPAREPATSKLQPQPFDRAAKQPITTQGRAD
jgi:ABC-type Mn2+/Zn2+ transport system permease subunit